MGETIEDGKQRAGKKEGKKPQMCEKKKNKAVYSEKKKSRVKAEMTMKKTYLLYA